MNDERTELYMRFNGCCAYCGTSLGKGWHVNRINKLEVVGGTPNANKLPACPACSLARGKLTIEEFRGKIHSDVWFLQQASIQYRTAKRFGLIHESEFRVIFYFEKHRP